MSTELSIVFVSNFYQTFFSPKMEEDNLGILLVTYRHSYFKDNDVKHLTRNFENTKIPLDKNETNEMNLHTQGVPPKNLSTI